MKIKNNFLILNMGYCYSLILTRYKNIKTESALIPGTSTGIGALRRETFKTCRVVSFEDICWKALYH